mmetsp:Transcript_4292/g.6544  ORF Transcript_4292/g.6544 Transcript_4292/m.6544 type:complete len:402 (+) Transcript_4292:725-1930(+)
MLGRTSVWQTGSKFQRRRSAKISTEEPKKIVTNYQYTASDIAAMVERNSASGKAYNTTIAKIKLEREIGAVVHNLERENNRLALARTKVGSSSINERTLALRECNDCKSQRDTLAQKLKGLEERLKKIQQIESQNNNALSNDARESRLHALNERNRKINQEADERAKNKKLKTIESGEEVQYDPFQRRRTRPKNIWSVGKREVEEDDAYLEGEDMVKLEGELDEEKNEAEFEEELLSVEQPEKKMEVEEEGLKDEDKVEIDDILESKEDENDAEVFGFAEAKKDSSEEEYSDSFARKPTALDIFTKIHAYGGVDPIEHAKKVDEEEKSLALAAKASAFDNLGPALTTDVKSSSGMSLQEYLKHASKMREMQKQHNFSIGYPEGTVDPFSLGTWGGGVTGND